MKADELKKITEHIRRADEVRALFGIPFVIAIDGRAASGKTTIAKALAEITDASIVHMDDFFLPAALRTSERYLSPGGNVHFERFREEVLPYIRKPGSFRYRAFNCSVMDYDREVIVPDNHFRIVEGSYSMHPAFGDYADLTLFVSVPASIQRSRLEEREGGVRSAEFNRKWIPLEEAYIKSSGADKKADILLENIQ